MLLNLLETVTHEAMDRVALRSGNQCPQCDADLYGDQAFCSVTCARNAYEDRIEAEAYSNLPAEA